MFSAFFEGMKTAQDIDPNIAVRQSCRSASISAFVRRHVKNITDGGMKEKVLFDVR
jgi:hypothetical protein